MKKIHVRRRTRKIKPRKLRGGVRGIRFDIDEKTHVSKDRMIHFNKVNDMLTKRAIYDNATPKQKSKHLKHIKSIRNMARAPNMEYEKPTDEELVLFKAMKPGYSHSVTKKKRRKTTTTREQEENDYRLGLGGKEMLPEEYRRLKCIKENMKDNYGCQELRKIFESRGNTDNMGSVISFLQKSPEKIPSD